MANDGDTTESTTEEVDYSKWTDEQLVEAGWTAQQVVDLRLGNTESNDEEVNEEEVTEEEASEEEVTEEEVTEEEVTEEEATEEEATEEEATEEEATEEEATEEEATEEEATEEENEDSEAFEVRLVGGLSVLRDSHDPLYVMQAITNLASTAVIAWTMISLLLGWKNNEPANNGWWVLIALILGIAVLLVVILEAFLSHDRELKQKLSRFSRWTQYFMTAWLVGLFIWVSGDNGPDLRGAEPLLEMSVIWVLLFVIIEFVNRFRLGKMEWKGGRDLLTLMQSSVSGLTSVVTGSEINQMKASSRSVMEGIRWALDFFSLLFFMAIVILTTGSTVTTLEEALSYLPLGLDSYGLNVIVKPALWLGSIYLLIFLAQTWLRIRPEEIES
jgi:hypothetical protein